MTCVQYCTAPQPTLRLNPDLSSDRQELIIRNSSKWLNGTVLHYHFMDRWPGSNLSKDVVAEAFKIWKDVGIGLDFEEVETPGEAEIRIGFEIGAGSWSYVGRDVLRQSSGERTMNFGWNITNDIDTVLHEIGHTLGFPHEHQNPQAGIEWNTEEVYARLAASPNFWDRATTDHNILNKLDSRLYSGSSWDRNSIMHYPFEAGMINSPSVYRTRPLIPSAGLSAQDKAMAKRFYPPLRASNPKLKPFVSRALSLAAGKQIDFDVEIKEPREYNFSTMGQSDTVMVLFEEVDGELRKCLADDDSGQDKNARFKGKLYPERKYVLRLRLYWVDQIGNFSVVMW